MFDTGDEDDETWQQLFGSGMMLMLRYESHGHSARLEPVTRPEYELQLAQYSEKLLGILYRQNKFEEFDIELVEFDEYVQLKCFIVRHVVHDFAKFMQNTAGRYVCAPQFHAEGFGFRSGNPLWVFPHDKYPAVFFLEEERARATYWLAEQEARGFNYKTIGKPPVFAPKHQGDLNLQVPEEFKPKPLRRPRRGRKIA